MAQASKTPPKEMLPALQALQRGDLATAFTAAQSAVPFVNDRSPFLAIASLAALRMGSPERAIPILHELIDLHPEDDASRANLAQALNETGDFSGAIEVTKGMREPKFLRVAGYAHQQLGQLEQSAECYKAVLEFDPTDLASLNNLGNVFVALGLYDEAIVRFEQAITLAPGEVSIYLNLADVLRRADRGDARLKVMKDAAVKAPNDRAVMIELALAYAHTDDLDRAIEILVRAIRIYPEFGEGHIELGRLYEALNRVDELESLINSIDASQTSPEFAFLQAWLAQRKQQFDQALNFALKIPDTIHPMRRFHLIGSINERMGDTESAFDAFERMNQEALADSPQMAGPSYRESLEQELKFWTDDWARSWQSSNSQSTLRDPIFLVGFPRSGTTLLDTMLMGLPEVCILEEKPMLTQIVGELNSKSLPEMQSDRIHALRTEYYNFARALGWNPDRLLIDKHPLHMARVPHIVRIFPNARFIIAERHPYDVVLSCFMANFQLNWAMRSFTDLKEAAATYHAVFSAWEQSKNLFDISTQTVRYERLIDNPKAELEPIVRWLGLEWNDQVLNHVATANSRGRVRTASYSQIGEKIYTRSRYRWKRYQAKLQPVLPLLRPWAAKMGYETGDS